MSAKYFKSVWYIANTQCNKHIIITSKCHFDVIIPCLLHFVFAGRLLAPDSNLINRVFDLKQGLWIWGSDVSPTMKIIWTMNLKDTETSFHQCAHIFLSQWSAREVTSEYANCLCMIACSGETSVRRSVGANLYVCIGCTAVMFRSILLSLAGLILGLCPANGRHCYKVTLSLIGWAQT